jgi:hypothetical protein
VRRFLALLWAWLKRFARFLEPWRWGLTVTVLTLAANLAAFATLHQKDPESDGKYNWIYARSLAFDHDIDFTNDYDLCGDHGKLGKERGGGHPDNPFYIGPSLFWVPAIEVARNVYHFSPNAPKERKKACDGPIAKAALAMGSVAAALLVWLSYCAARRLRGDYVAALGAALFAFGTTMPVYATRFASYSHVYDGACVAAYLLLSLRAYEKPERLHRWALAGTALAACILHRLTNAPLGMLAAGFALFALHGRPKLLAGAVLALAIPAFVLGVGLQLCIYKYFYGHYFFVPQGPYFFQPAHAHPWLLLFAPKGLFFMAPVAWLSVAGAILAFRRGPSRKALLLVLAMFALEHFLASCALDWDAAATVGARRLISLFPLLVFLATPALAGLVAWVSRGRERMRGLFLLTLLGPLGFIFFGAALIADNAHNYEFYPSETVMYGGGVTATFEAIERVAGAAAILPAQLVYKLRYAAPLSSYWAATQREAFSRSPFTLELSHASLDLEDPQVHAATPGFSGPNGKKSHLQGQGRVIFVAEWPYATGLAVTALSAEAPTDLRVTGRTFFGTSTVYGTVSLTSEEKTFKLTIPPGGYDSGVEELVFETVDGANAEIRKIELVDDTVYPPVR